MLIIDGSVGEGGGQILRSSLALSMATAQPVRIANIRAGRTKPGLLRQHLTCVHAAQAVCGAQVQGAEMGSSEVTFTPAAVRGGDYDFAIGTAGSTSLVLQTVLPALLATNTQAHLRLTGGTHNSAAPCYDFLAQIYFPLLRKMGAELESELHAVGFYPAGGGEVTVRVKHGITTGFELGCLTGTEQCTAWTLSSKVPEHVAERELAVLSLELGTSTEPTAARRTRSAGPGNVVCVKVGDHELVTTFGERGKPAERVANDAVRQVRAYLSAGTLVGEHLADQLLLPLSWVGGHFRTGVLSSHAHTNIDVIRRFLGESAVQVSVDGAHHIVTCPGYRRP